MTPKLRNTFLLIFFLAFATGTLVSLKYSIVPNLKEKAVTDNRPKVVLNNQMIFVEIADTEEKRNQGLSGREKLTENEGMLFVFDKQVKSPFWMKEMKFSLDFVFIDGDKVVDLKENVPFPKEGESPQYVYSNQPYDKVLEINAGMIKKLKIRVGDSLKIVL